MNGRTNTTSVTEVVEGVQVALEAPTNLVLTPLNARVDLTWTDPVDKYAAPDGQTATNPWDNVATWDHSIVVRKAGSAPTSPDDGELIYTETTRNQHQYTAYSDTDNVINNTEYYYAVYAVTTMGAVSDPIVDHCKPIEGTPQYYKTINMTSVIFEDDNLEESANVSDSVIFHGHRGGGWYSASAFYKFDPSLTMSRIGSIEYITVGIKGASTPAYAFFAGGSYSTRGAYGTEYKYSNAVTAFDESYTQHNNFSTLTDEKDIGGATGLNQYGIFAGGSDTLATRGTRKSDVNAFDDNLTRMSLSNLETVKDFIGAGTIVSAQVALFGGGYINHDEYVNIVECYNASLTKSILAEPLSAKMYNSTCVVVDDIAMFLGGDLGDSDTNVINAYDSSLTKLPNGRLPGAFSNAIAEATGGYAIFFYNQKVYAIDSSLTQTIIVDESMIKAWPTGSGTVDKYTLIADSNATDLHVFQLQ